MKYILSLSRESATELLEQCQEMLTQAFDEVLFSWFQGAEP